MPNTDSWSTAQQRAMIYFPYDTNVNVRVCRERHEKFVSKACVSGRLDFKMKREIEQQRSHQAHHSLK